MGDYSKKWDQKSYISLTLFRFDAGTCRRRGSDLERNEYLDCWMSQNRLENIGRDKGIHGFINK